MEKALIGIHDLPIYDHNADLFDVDPYIEALSDFIRESATPITIALQGGWGTGKTSFINLINHKLQPEKQIGTSNFIKPVEKSKKKKENNEEVKNDPAIITVTFNTWQYTQFNLESNLGISFLSYIISKLTKDLKIEFNKAVNEALNVLRKAANIGLNIVLTQAGMEPIKFDNNKGSNLDTAQAIELLKESLQEIVTKLLEEYRKNGRDARLVIFIDDLDRLNPTVAVSLLEVIKLFLDIEGCVFVLAVDNRVIEEGIAKSKDTSKQKTRSFLDKMIQVPFKIPVEIYNYQKFLSDNLGKISSNEELEEELQRLIQFSVGSNPRAMKRLINNFYLNNKVNSIIDRRNEEAKSTTEHEQSILLAVICMQLAFQPLYILMSKTDNKLDLINKEKAGRDTFIEVLSEEFKEYENLNLYEEDAENHLENYERYIDHLRKIILLTVGKKVHEEDEEDDIVKITEKDLTIFNTILRRSEMTSGSGDNLTARNPEHNSNLEVFSLTQYINSPKKYQLVSKRTFLYRDKNQKEQILDMKDGFRFAVNKSITLPDHINKLKDLDGLMKVGISRTMYHRLLPESEWLPSEKKEKRILNSKIQFGTEENNTVTLGYHFNNKEAAINLYKLLNYLNSEIIDYIYLRGYVKTES